jgi:histidine kinase/DNA gyrase B/HSP90-like ATPase
MSWRSRFGLHNLLALKSTERAPVAAEEGDKPLPIKTRAVQGEEDARIWAGEFPIAGKRVLPPDPRMMRAIGLNHSFETAVADIVDNSIDAGASKVLIRIIREAGRLVGLCIVDDGRGMDDTTIDRAMTVGGDRTYADGDLGHFGIGLKAASLGQARSLTVASRAKAAAAVARRWRVESAATGFECDVVQPDFAISLLDRDWEYLTASTVVMWTEVKGFAAIADGREIDRFVDRYLMTLRHHLGLVFHRLLSEKKVEIAVDVEDVAAHEIGLRFLIEPVDPFAYVRSGKGSYPKVLKSTWQGQALEFSCHIWPGRSNHPNFKLFGSRPEAHQGFYIYRNDRLLQQGGWNGVVLPERDLLLARVAIDVHRSDATLFTMNAEKTRVEVSADFSTIVQGATDGKTSFFDYIEHAKSAYRDSQKRRRQRPKVMRPGRGFAEAVRSAIDDEYEYLPGDGLDIKWGDLADDTFFEIDRENSVIRLNRRYRSAVIGGRNSSLNDAPLVKALIYLLAEGTFHGAFLGVRRKDNLGVWQSILTAAARVEMK